jgi:hypothetical protein
MLRSIRFISLLVGGVFPLSVLAQNSQQFVSLVDRVWHQSANEATQIGVTVKSQLRGYDLGPPFPAAMATARWFLVGGNSLTANFVDQEFDLANGFATFRIELVSMQSDKTACLLVNAQEICSVNVENGRLVYRARVLIKRTATTATADELPLPASLDLSLSWSVYDRSTHATSTGGADIIPIAVLDGNAIVTESY